MSLVLNILFALQSALSPMYGQIAAIYNQIVSTGPGRVRAWVLETWAAVTDAEYGLHSVAATLFDGTFGLAAAHTERQAILAAIAALPAGSDIVIPSSSDNASAVWGVTDPNSSPANVYGNELWSPYQAAHLATVRAPVRSRFDSHFLARGDFTLTTWQANLNNDPEPDWSAILPSDTRLSWLNRTASTFTWTEDPDSHVITGVDNFCSYDCPVWFFTLSEQEFALLRATPRETPPIYPGSAGVVDGTPVVVTSPQLVVGPMHGLHVTVDAVKPNTSHQTVGVHLNYFRAGYIAFVSDVGEVELLQWLGFDAADYCPTSMAEASSVLVYPNAATQVTVTPWLLA